MYLSKVLQENAVSLYHCLMQYFHLKFCLFERWKWHLSPLLIYISLSIFTHLLAFSLQWNSSLKLFIYSKIDELRNKTGNRAILKSILLALGTEVEWSGNDRALLLHSTNFSKQTILSLESLKCAEFSSGIEQGFPVEDVLSLRVLGPN